MGTVKVLGICGSPRKRGNSRFLLERVLASANGVTGGHVESDLYSFAGKKIDPCISCTDRVMIADSRRSKTKRVMGWEELRQYGIRWYAEKD